MSVFVLTFDIWLNIINLYIFCLIKLSKSYFIKKKYVFDIHINNFEEIPILYLATRRPASRACIHYRTCSTIIEHTSPYMVIPSPYMVMANVEQSPHTDKCSMFDAFVLQRMQALREVDGDRTGAGRYIQSTHMDQYVTPPALEHIGYIALLNERRCISFNLQSIVMKVLLIDIICCLNICQGRCCFALPAAATALLLIHVHQHINKSRAYKTMSPVKYFQ